MAPDELIEIGLFKRKSHGHYRISNTSFEFFVYGKPLHLISGRRVRGSKWWKRNKDREYFPVSIDEVMISLSEEQQIMFLFNLDIISKYNNYNKYNI